MTTRVQIIYWRDIPAQVKARSEDKRVGRPLAKRFQVAIGEAAMRAGKTRSEDYIAEWRMSAWQEREGDPDELVTALVSELEADYPPSWLRTLIRQGGLAEEIQAQE